jgi:outer membrane protein insertion porin family
VLLFLPRPARLLPTALALAGWLGEAVALAQPAPAAGSPAAAEVDAPSPPVPPAPAAAAPGGTAPRIAGFELDGSIDPPGRLESFVAMFLPTGGPYVEAGAADRIGTPISTVPRLELALKRLGYGSVIEPKLDPAAPGGPAVRFAIHLRAYDRVRQIFVDGSWPLRQDELIRRLTLRAGVPLPPPGPERDERLERERQSVLSFLHDQGYLEAQVAIELHAPDRVPAPVNLLLKVDHGPGYPVGPVNVRGNTAISTETIDQTFRHTDWRTLDIVLLCWKTWRGYCPAPFQRSVLREDLASLTQKYRDIGYAWARVTTDYDPIASVDRARHEIHLDVTVRERKKVEVFFSGNDRFDNDELRDRLTIFTRGAYDAFETEASVEAIKQAYHNKGHMFVQASARTDSSAPDVHRIYFTIVEGPRLKVRGVSFSGNHAFTADQLREGVTVTEFPFLGSIGLGEGGYASLRQLELDEARLTEFYKAAGYRETKVRVEIAPTPGRWQARDSVTDADPAWHAATALYVRFVIEESPRVDVAEVTFEAAEGEALPYSASFLRDSLDLKAGSPLRPAVVRSDADRLRRLLGDAGHPHATAEANIPAEGTKVPVVWRFRLGPRVRVGPMFVRGNFLTSEGTIRSWTLLRPGDLLTTTAFERSQRNLALIQIFNNASPITFPPEAQAGDTIPMLVEIEERHDHWGVVHLGGGASTEQATPGAEFPVGAYGAVAYEHRNLFGQDWQFQARAERGNSVTRVVADFTDPRFFSTLFRLGITGAYLRQATVRLGDLRSGSGSIGFSRELYSGVDASLFYGLRDTSRTEFLVRGAGPFAEQGSVSIGTIVGSLTLSVEWQRLDHPLAPTRGFKIQGGVELAAPELSFGAGDDAFIKTQVRALAVVPLTGRLSLHHSVRYDQGFPLGGFSVLPKVERFFAGGDTTLRGFDLDRARTEVTEAVSGPGVVFVKFHPVGGSLRLLDNIDLQFRVAGPWFVGVFCDTGIVADSFVGLRVQDFRHGAGIAPFVFKLPIGDISIAWGWPLDPQAGDSRLGRLHLNVGLMF